MKTIEDDQLRFINGRIKQHESRMLQQSTAGGSHFSHQPHDVQSCRVSQIENIKGIEETEALPDHFVFAPRHQLPPLNSDLAFEAIPTLPPIPDF